MQKVEADRFWYALPEEDIEDGESVMTAEYRPVEYGNDYDVVNHPDKFQLYIDGKEVEE